jgi:hypothetical protein
MARILNEGCRLLCEPDVRFDQTFFQVGSHAMRFSPGGLAYSLARLPEPQALPRALLHAIVDNLSTHKPKNDRWLKQHPNAFPLHADARFLAQSVEIWFSILHGKFKGASFTSVKQLRDHIDAFIQLQ